MSWADILKVFARIGLMSFGGPAAQIALMHKELVETRPWLTEQQFLRALSFCMLLPGPEAMQLATYAGWRLKGVPGGLLAGLLFVLPGAAVILLLALVYAAIGGLDWVQAVFLGIKAVVVVIVIENAENRRPLGHDLAVAPRRDLRRRPRLSGAAGAVLLQTGLGHLRRCLRGAGLYEGGVSLAILAGLVTLWVTFAPCFLWIFAGAPYIDWLASRPRLAAALTAITAAVVGVILNLTLWFALNLFFADLTNYAIGPISLLLPDLTSLQPTPVILALIAGYLLFIRHMDLIILLGVAGAMGWISGVV